MTTQLGQQLIRAFTNGAQGGNPSYVIATTGAWPDLEQECTGIAHARACEVTHIHFDQKPGQASLRFYVSSGPIDFCGHGALAATAWAAAAGRAGARLLLNYGRGQLQMQIEGDSCFGFVEPAGNLRELELDQSLRVQIATMLGLDDLPSNCVRLWLGGRQRPKALIALPSKPMLSKLKILPDMRDQFCRQHDVTGIYPFVPEHDGKLAARHFPFHAGTDEDMATGNIAATVAALVCGATPKPLTIAQGGPECSVARLRLIPSLNGNWFVGGSCHIDA